MTSSRTFPKAIDLFSGCGGLTLGLKKAGFSVVAAVEIDKRAADTYSKNHPTVTLFNQSILSLTGSDILEVIGIPRGKIDLLAGCPPCQGFSRMRRKNKIASSKDHRNDLVLKFARLVSEISPKAVMLENVPGLERDRRFRKLLGTLRRNGYKFSWKILDASDYGVPQRRRRLVLLGCKTKRPIVGNIPTAKPKSVYDAIRSIEHPRKTLRPLHKMLARYSEPVKRIIRSIPKDGGSRSHLPAKMTLACHRQLEGFRDVYGRMKWHDQSPTITGGCVNTSKGRFLHPRQDRAITVFEASLLQSFPRTYKFLPKYGRYPNAEMIGNALPPRFAHKVSSYLADVIRNNG
jgi:DNA (cytosine-5)-methyltransferase 1